MTESSTRDVFINCPFDPEFAQGFQALVFSVIACGFRARCAREAADAAENRIDKIYRIIEQCRYGIHDISRTELDDVNGLPRFNMPLELGIFLGAKRFGGPLQKKKSALVMDREAYRFQKFISDLGGIDPVAHESDPRRMVECARDWLMTASRRASIPGTQAVLDCYDQFVVALPELARDARLDPGRIQYPDYERLVIAWVKLSRQRGLL